MKCATYWRRCRKPRLRKKMGWEQRVSEFNKITASAAAKPFTILTFTSSLRSAARPPVLLRRGESSRRQSITRQPRSCARRGRNNRRAKLELRRQVRSQAEIGNEEEMVVGVTSLASASSPPTYWPCL